MAITEETKRTLGKPIGKVPSGVYILTATFVKVVFLKVSPEINGKNEIMMVARGQAMKSSSTEPLVVTLAVS